jgi:hypothetical protein
MAGLRCRACRRYVLRRAHLVVLVVLCLALVVALLDLFAL